VLAAGACRSGVGDEPADGVSSVSLAAESESCGNGALDLYRVAPPACPNPAIVTEVFDRAGLDAWLASRTTTLKFGASIALAGEPLDISTACDVLSRDGVALTGLTDVFVAARRIDVYTDISASGRVDLRAGESIHLRIASSVTGPAGVLALEAPTVDDYADTTVSQMYCIEGGQVTVRTASKNGSTGGEVKISGSGVDAYGDFTTPGNVRVTSTGNLVLREAARLTGAGDVTLAAGGLLDVHGDLIGAGQVVFDAGGDLTYRQAARIENASSVAMSSDGFLDFHGSLVNAGDVSLACDSFWYRDAALVETSGDVSVAIGGTTLTEFYGTIRSNGNVALVTDSLYLRQAGLIKSDRDVTLEVATRYDMRGKVQQNEDVRVLTGTFKLYGTHSFAGNASCIIAGTRTPDSVAAVGCSESPDGSAPTWPPASSLIASAIGPTSLTLAWTAATDDVGVVGYRVYQDGALIGETDAGTRTVDVSGLTPGTTYVFKVEAGDAAGRWSRSGPATTATTTGGDTTPPTIYIDLPSEGQSFRFPEITVRGRVEDDDAVATAWVNDAVVPPSAGWFTTTVALAEGPNTIVVAAVDRSGNRAEQAVHVVYAPDTTGPTITVAYPLEGDVVFETPVDVIGTVTDASPIVGVFVNGVAAEVAAGEFHGSADLLPGENTVVVSALDDLGNRSEVSVTVTLEEWGPPPGPTDGWIHGRVFDAATGAPLAGAHISSTEIGLSVVSDGEGKFVYSVPPVDDRPPAPLEADGTRPVRLRITADGYLEAVRVVEVPRHPLWFETAVEPAYLARRDPATTPIGPEGGVAWNSLHTVALEIPAGALDHTVEVRLTEYRTGRSLPMPLPETTKFTYAVKLEPDGTDFSVPVRLLIANELGFEGGTAVPVGLFDGLEWVDVGMSYVTEDGGWLAWENLTHFSSFDLNLASDEGEDPET
ncbi:MAG: fibronectin type III domain-containing protein, partial [Myxococcota bacterium]|nr:fibronectin type III domain-containing protein [Myxococcota bacterium]